MLAAYRKLKSENEGYRDRITRNLERRFDHGPGLWSLLALIVWLQAAGR